MSIGAKQAMIENMDPNEAAYTLEKQLSIKQVENELSMSMSRMKKLDSENLKILQQ